MRIHRHGDGWIAVSQYADRGRLRAAGWRWDPAARRWWTDRDERAAKLAAYASDWEDRKTLEGIAAKVTMAVEASRAADASIEIPAPPGLAYLSFQRAAIAYMADRAGVLLADEPGLGKTVEVLGVLNIRVIRRVLVICPASLRLNWAAEAGKWLVVPREIGIETMPDDHGLSMTIGSYEWAVKNAAMLTMADWDLMVCDEAHYLKSERSARTRATLGYWDGEDIAGIRASARRLFLLTGTPEPNRPVELWPLLHALDPAAWRNKLWYGKRYCGATYTGYGWDFTGSNPRTTAELQEKLRSTVMIRRLKRDVMPELPAKVRQVIELMPSGAAASAVEAEAQEAAATGAGDLLTESGWRERISGVMGNGKAYAFTECATARHRVALASVAHVAGHVAMLRDSGQKVIVFAHHRDVQDHLADALGDGVVVYRGGMDDGARDEVVRRFQEDGDVRVMIAALSNAVGYTATAADVVVFAELDWVPGIMTQAEDRAHRIGATGSLLIQYVVMAGSIAARMGKVLVEKLQVTEGGLDHVAATV